MRWACPPAHCSISHCWLLCGKPLRAIRCEVSGSKLREHMSVATRLRAGRPTHPKTATHHEMSRPTPQTQSGSRARHEPSDKNHDLGVDSLAASYGKSLASCRLIMSGKYVCQGRLAASVSVRRIFSVRSPIDRQPPRPPTRPRQCNSHHEQDRCHGHQGRGSSSGLRKCRA